MITRKTIRSVPVGRLQLLRELRRCRRTSRSCVAVSRSFPPAAPPPPRLWRSRESADAEGGGGGGGAAAGGGGGGEGVALGAGRRWDRRDELLRRRGRVDALEVARRPPPSAVSPVVVAGEAVFAAGAAVVAPSAPVGASVAAVAAPAAAAAAGVGVGAPGVAEAAAGADGVDGGDC